MSTLLKTQMHLATFSYDDKNILIFIYSHTYTHTRTSLHPYTHTHTRMKARTHTHTPHIHADMCTHPHNIPPSHLLRALVIEHMPFALVIIDHGSVTQLTLALFHVNVIGAARHS